MKRNIIIIIGILALVATVFLVMNLAQSPESMSEDTTMTEPGDMTTDDMTEDAMVEDEVATDSMDKETMSNEGSMAEDFELVNIAGEKVSLEQLKGKPVYVKFWASWCPICLAGMDELNSLSADVTDFKVITIVSPGYNGEMEKDEFITWFEGLDYDNIEVLLDEDATIAKAYGVRGYPTSVYIGSDSVLVKMLPGHAENSIIKETFENIY
ncbi:MAG: redoxin domain-containing protein [Gudongella sp.]|nr:redoxin domain-containing protein [Gudongella sp.]